MTTMNEYRTTRYHYPAEGEYFTLDQLTEKLAEWSVEVDEWNVTHYGWNLEDRGFDRPWVGKIPGIGKTFKVYVSQFFQGWTREMVVKRESQNLFRVIRWDT